MYVRVTSIASTTAPSLVMDDHPVAHLQAAVRPLGDQAVVGDGQDGRSLALPDRIKEVRYFNTRKALIEGTISGLFRFHQAFTEDLNLTLIAAVG